MPILTTNHQAYPFNHANHPKIKFVENGLILTKTKQFYPFQSTIENNVNVKYKNVYGFDLYFDLFDLENKVTVKCNTIF